MDVNDISRLSTGSTLRGNFYSEKDIRVDGLFEGDICTKGKVVVGENAVVKGTVVCGKADILGKVEGKIYVKDLLELMASASVTGEFHFGRLQVEAGAEILGSCHKITDQVFEEQQKEP